jgi:hypothetical protein
MLVPRTEVMMTWREQLETDGFALLHGAFTAEEMRRAILEWDGVLLQNPDEEAILTSEGGPPYGARNLLHLWPQVMRLARQSLLRNALREELGGDAGVVRALFFDKPPGHSWALPWHKDYNIAVVEHGREVVFTKPTRKAGVPHVMAPFSLLREMLTARIHLDDVTDKNGPLRLIPGSHRFYQTGEDEMRELVAIHCRAGDVLLMRPLLTHSSGHSQPEAGRHRRIIHLECAKSSELPDGYRWHDFEPLDS